MGAITPTTEGARSYVRAPRRTNQPGGRGVIAAARRGRSCSALVALALVLAAQRGGAAAHDPGLSTLSLTLSERPARAQVVLVVDDDVLPEPHSAHAGRCRGLSPFAISLRSPQPVRVSCGAEPGGRTRFEASILYTGAGTLRVQLPLLDALPHGHQVYAKTVRPNGRVAVERILRQGTDQLELELDAPPAAGLWLRGGELFAAQPVQLLLLPLLLWGMRGARRAAACVATFVAAQALGIALAALGLVDVARELVALATASSIALAALYAYRTRRSLGERLDLSLLLGLVHGLSFAPELAPLGLQGVPALRPLLELATGVALGQAALGASAWLVLRGLRGGERIPLPR